MNEYSHKEKAFLQSYDRYATSMYRHVRLRVGSNQDAEDIVSQTFLKTWDYLSRGKTVLNMKAFIFRVANNLIIDWYRGKDARPVPMEEVPEAREAVAADKRLEERLDAKIEVAQLEAAIGAVEGAYRDVLVLKYVEELSIQEIARKLSVTENVVYVRLHRARKKLFEQLSGGSN